MNQINSGTYLSINNQIWQVTEYQHVKPGKGAAFVRAKLRNIQTDAVIERTFKPADRLENVNLQEKKVEFLYEAGGTCHFMCHSTYEQMAVSSDIVGDSAKYLLENLEVTLLMQGTKVIKLMLPIFIIAEITSTEPGIRGDSSRAGTKPARIATGATIAVPLFVNQGDTVKVDTRTGQYVERVKQ